MTKISLDNGFKCIVDESKFDDMRFVDALAELDDKPQMIGKVATMVLGDEQKNALYKHIEVDGKVSVETFTASFTEILNKCSNGKKS